MVGTLAVPLGQGPAPALAHDALPSNAYDAESASAVLKGVQAALEIGESQAGRTQFVHKVHHSGKPAHQRQQFLMSEPLDSTMEWSSQRSVRVLRVWARDDILKQLKKKRCAKVFR